MPTDSRLFNSSKGLAERLLFSRPELTEKVLGSVLSHRTLPTLAGAGVGGAVGGTFGAMKYPGIAGNAADPIIAELWLRDKLGKPPPDIAGMRRAMKVRQRR